MLSRKDILGNPEAQKESSTMEASVLNHQGFLGFLIAGAGGVGVRLFRISGFRGYAFGF